MCIAAVIFAVLILQAGKSSGMIKLQVPTIVYAGEAINVNCTGSVQDFRNAFMPMMVLMTGDGCTKHHDDAPPKKFKDNSFQKSFNITCQKGNHEIKCVTNSISQTGATELQALERPTRVTNKPSNVTINVGLPVTLTCYVQGDPNHYWVGWMSRQTVIQEGDEYSVSTSPNFKSPNGTIHHLTIHSVKEAGKYECKVYTIAGDFQDQVTHQIIINDDKAESFSLWDALRKYINS